MQEHPANGDLRAPWTPDQVVTLNWNQRYGHGHPYTCPHRSDGKHPYDGRESGVLVATVGGWVCPFCNYTQSTCLAQSANQRFDAGHAHGFRDGALFAEAHGLDSVVRQKVGDALALSAGPGGRRLELPSCAGAGPMTRAEREAALLVLFKELAKGMGMDRFQETPALALDQFSVMTVARNEDTQGLVRSLVNSFLLCYATPETHAGAKGALLALEGLRAQLAAMAPPTRH